MAPLAPWLRLCTQEKEDEVKMVLSYPLQQNASAELYFI